MANTYHDQLTGSDLHENKVNTTTGTELTPASQATYDGRWKTPLDNHVASTGNPHATTAAQVGAAPTSRTLATTAPLTGGGDLSANRTLSIPAATGSQGGYLAAADWTIFAAKQSRIALTVGPTGSNSDYICDGTADNSKIQSAVDAVGNAGGGVVRILPGTYSIDDRIRIGKNNVHLVGSGVGATILRCNFDAVGTVAQNTKGVILFFNPDGVTPIKHGVVRDLSIDLNNMATAGIFLRAATNAAVLSEDFRIENIEIYNRGADSSGAVGAIQIHADYTAILGSMKNVTLRCVEIHDGNATTGSKIHGTSIRVQSDSLSRFTIKECYFHDIYGDTISKSSTNTNRGNQDWVIDGCYFKNTIQKYWSTSVADIKDSTANGFNGIKITNCTFDSDTTWANADGAYAIAIYQSYGFIVDHCHIHGYRTAIAPGRSTPSGAESIGWTFSNNVVHDCIFFSDPDGHYAGIYANNVFYNINRGALLGGYGRHYPSVYDGNLFYNCCLDPDLTLEHAQGIFRLQDGGNVVQNNVIYDDTPSTKLKYVFCEHSAGGSTTYPNIYRNNVVLGNGPTTKTFYVNSQFKHVIQNNSGITEALMQNSATGTTLTTSDLAGTDTVTGNSRLDGTPVSNPTPIPATILATKTSAYTLTATDSVILANATSAAFQVTLPSAAGISGRQYTIKRTNSGGNNVTVGCTGGQMVDGAATKTLGVQFSYVTIVSDGAGWQVVGQGGTVS